MKLQQLPNELLVICQRSVDEGIMDASPCTFDDSSAVVLKKTPRAEAGSKSVRGRWL